MQRLRRLIGIPAAQPVSVVLEWYGPSTLCSVRYCAILYVTYTQQALPAPLWIGYHSGPLGTAASHQYTVTCMTDPILIRVAEAAKLLSVSKSTAYQLAAAGVIPTVRIGRAVRVPLSELRAWVRRQHGQEDARG